MASLSVREEPVETESEIEAMDITEMKSSIALNLQVCKAEEEQLNMEVLEQGSLNKSSINTVEKTSDSKQPLAYFRTSARLINYSSANMIISSTRSLLEDFYLMSQSRKSVYCSKILFGPFLVQCYQCGRQFMGKGDRLLKLSNHFKAKHKIIAEKLFLDMIKRYGTLLERMRKFLHNDRLLIAAQYD